MAEIIYLGWKTKRTLPAETPLLGHPVTQTVL
jgi:hypothetical protein